MCSYITNLSKYSSHSLVWRRINQKCYHLQICSNFRLICFILALVLKKDTKVRPPYMNWQLYFSDDRIQFSGGKSITLSVNTVWQSNLNSCTSLFPARLKVFMLVLRVLVNWITFSPVQKKSRSLLLCVFLSPFCIFLNLILFLFYCLSVWMWF